MYYTIVHSIFACYGLGWLFEVYTLQSTDYRLSSWYVDRYYHAMPCHIILRQWIDTLGLDRLFQINYQYYLTKPGQAMPGSHKQYRPDRWDDDVNVDRLLELFGCVRYFLCYVIYVLYWQYESLSCQAMLLHWLLWHGPLQFIIVTALLITKIDEDVDSDIYVR